MSDYMGMMMLVALTGLIWIVGGLLQWLNLRKQERLLTCLREETVARAIDYPLGLSSTASSTQIREL